MYQPAGQQPQDCGALPGLWLRENTTARGKRGAEKGLQWSSEGSCFLLQSQWILRVFSLSVFYLAAVEEQMGLLDCELDLHLQLCKHITLCGEPSINVHITTTFQSLGFTQCNNVNILSLFYFKFTHRNST